MHSIKVLPEALEFLYVLLPVLPLTFLAYKLTSETGKRTGSSLFFFSFIFYLIGVYESLYITIKFNVIANYELLIIQLLYLTAGFLLIVGSISLYKFFIRITGIGDLKKTLKKVSLFILAYFSLVTLYLLNQSHERLLYLLTNVFYILIQSQFFVAYFIFGDVMYTNKDICVKSPKRSMWIKFTAFCYLIEAVLWIYFLRVTTSLSTLDGFCFSLKFWES